MVLARQGFSVEVFEKRPEPEADTVDTYVCWRGVCVSVEQGGPHPHMQVLQIS